MDKKDAEHVRISGGLLARNMLLNLIGQAVPLLVGVVTIPFVLRGLGIERFGLLSLAWVLMGYFTIFDLGLGRATTKYVAEVMGKGGDRVPSIIWTAVTLQAILGFFWAFFLFGITDLLVGGILNIPPQLMAEAKYTFYLLAFSIPVVLVSGSFRGVVEAAQRFDLVNAVMIPFSILTFILPLVGLHLGLDVPGIVALIVLARFATLIAFIAMVFHIVPHLRDYSSSFEAFSSLFAFSIWATITSVVVPILVYLDRFLISSLLTIAALAYYTVPYEVATRIWIITTSLTMTLFPAFSSLEGVGDGQKIGTLFARSLKYVLIATGPIISLIVVHARSILQIWLGNDFAIEGTIVMQVIGLGVLINSLGHTPFAFLQGIGRPDLPAKFHIIELPIYIVLVWILLSEFGIVGAACAWTLRVLLDTFLLFFAAFKIYPLKPGLLGENGTTPAIILLLAFASILYTLKWVTSSYPLIAQSLLSIGLLALFACAAWYYVLDDTDRRVINKAVNPKKIKEYNI